MHRKDREILELFQKEIQTNSPIKDVIREEKYEHSILNINSRYLVNTLKDKHSLFANKSMTMHSNVIKNIPEKYIYHFLRGYFDGDGNITYGVKYSSGTKYLVQIIGTQDFLENTFDKYFETNCFLYKYKTCNMFCWKISKKSQVDNFINLLYKDSNIYLKRKYKVLM